MRAAATLRLLAKWAVVDLVVVPLQNGKTSKPAQEVESLCKSWRVIENPEPAIDEMPPQVYLDVVGGADNLPHEWKLCNSKWQEKIQREIQDLKPTLVHVFRFYLAPYVLPGVSNETPCWLDLDELESRTRLRLSVILSIGGKSEDAATMEREGPAYRKLEKRFLRSFDRIFASSSKETESVLDLFPGASVRVLPNTYPLLLPHPQRTADGKARLLYVGTLDHFPNEDAVRFFCREVLPTIRACTNQKVEFTVIGSGWDKLKDRESIFADVKFVGAVPDTTPFYAESDIFVVPLRSAGGTRIKILEAFSHERAVVSTAMGGEGLDCSDGVHLEIADAADEFAEKCLMLIEDRNRRKRIASNGHELFRQQYAMHNLESNLAQLFAD